MIVGFPGQYVPGNAHLRTYYLPKQSIIMKKILLIATILFAVSNISLAQIKSAKLTASGLTCSMCSKAILKSLQKVPFIQDVQANIEQSSYTITFKTGLPVFPDVIKKAVENAGFSVASMQITANVPALNVSNDAHASVVGLNLHFMNVAQKQISGEQTFVLLDKGYLPSKDYKHYSQYTHMQCYQTGMMAPCCAKEAGTVAGRIYHVTL